MSKTKDIDKTIQNNNNNNNNVNTGSNTNNNNTLGTGKRKSFKVSATASASLSSPNDENDDNKTRTTVALCNNSDKKNTRSKSISKHQQCRKDNLMHTSTMKKPRRTKTQTHIPTTATSTSTSGASSLSNSKQELTATGIIDLKNNELTTAVTNNIVVDDNNNNDSTNNAMSSGGLTTSPNNLSLSPFITSTAQQLQQQQKASAKNNDRFHQLFPSIPLDEYLIDTYSCAYAKSLNLYQGVMFVTANYICFYSKILSSVILILKFSHINSITKSMHAMIFPTAIRIETHNDVYSFTSFRSRSHTLDHLAELLQQSRQRQIMNENSIRQRSKKLIQAAAAAAAAATASASATATLIPNDEQHLINESLSHITGATIHNMSEDKFNTTNEMKMTINLDSDDNDNLVDSGLGHTTMTTSSSQLIKKSTSSPLITVSDSAAYFDYCYGQQLPTNNLFYDFDFSDLSKNMVTVSLRHRQTLLQSKPKPTLVY